MAQLNASAVAAKWAARMAAAGDNMKNGVNAVTQNPAEAAAAAKDRWVAGIQKAAAAGKFEQGLANTTLQSWQKAMINKGIPNMQTGAREAQTKVQTFLSQLLPYTSDVSAKVKAMPKGTLSDSINRATAAITMMAQFRKSG